MSFVEKNLHQLHSVRLIETAGGKFCSHSFSLVSEPQDEHSVMPLGLHVSNVAGYSP